MGAKLDYCGEVHDLDPERPFVLGRDGDLVLDENPYIHRRFLVVGWAAPVWWLSNVGSQLSATVVDADGRMQAFLPPGGQVPLVFPSTAVLFTAGPTTYEFQVLVDDARFLPSAPGQPTGLLDGTTTVGQVSFTPAQRLLMLALAEPLLRNEARGSSSIPTSAVAAARLGWPLTTFNRKLDNVCDKLTRAGVTGLHGGQGRLAVNRRARLVEYAVATRLVGAEELGLLDRAPDG